MKSMQSEFGDSAGSNNGPLLESSRYRRADIQGLRAIAVLMVVAFHAGLPLAGGFVGVDVFFVISGFVITAMLQREWQATGAIHFSSFYVRRFKRLTPALALMVFVTMLGSLLILSPLGSQQAAAKTALGAMLLSANFVIPRTTGGYFDVRAEISPLLNTWSLSVEEQFYLLFPALLLLGWVVARRSRVLKRTPIIIVGLIAATSFGLAILSSTGYSLPQATWLLGFYSPFTRAWEFAAGALLALDFTRITIERQRIATGLGILGIGALTFSLLGISELTPFPGFWTVIPVAGTLLLLAAGTQNTNIVSKTLSSRPMIKIGDWSYSVYLWHWPFIVFARLLWPSNPAAVYAAVGVSSLPAIVSYNYVEQPFRSLRLKKGALTKAVLIITLTPIAVCLGAQYGWNSRAVNEAVNATTVKHAGTARRCFSTGPYDVANCVWNGSGSQNPIYLVGDSNALHFSEATIAAGKSLNRPVWIFTAPACPLILNLRLEVVKETPFFLGKLPDNLFDHCHSYVRYVIDWLGDAQPGTVLVAGLDQVWWDPSVAATLSNGVLTTDETAKGIILRRGMKSTVLTLQESGHQVVLIQTVPTFRNPPPVWDPHACSLMAILSNECFKSIPRSFVEDLQKISRKSLVDVADETGATIVDPRPWFCDQSSCSTQNDAQWRFQDAAHISVSTSESLAPEFVKILSTSD